MWFTRGKFPTISCLNQVPKMTNVRAGNLRAQFVSHFSVFPRSPHTMSLYVDMKMILSLNCSGLHCNSVKIGSIFPLWCSCGCAVLRTARVCCSVSRVTQATMSFWTVIIDAHFPNDLDPPAEPWNTCTVSSEWLKAILNTEDTNYTTTRRNWQLPPQKQTLCSQVSAQLWLPTENSLTPRQQGSFPGCLHSIWDISLVEHQMHITFLRTAISRSSFYGAPLSGCEVETISLAISSVASQWACFPLDQGTACVDSPLSGELSGWLVLGVASPLSHDGVLCFDHHVVWQKTILVRYFHTCHFHELVWWPSFHFMCVPHGIDGNAQTEVMFLHKKCWISSIMPNVVKPGKISTELHRLSIDLIQFLEIAFFPHTI